MGDFRGCSEMLVVYHQFAAGRPCRPYATRRILGPSPQLKPLALRPLHITKDDRRGEDQEPTADHLDDRKAPTGAEEAMANRRDQHELEGDNHVGSQECDM